MAVLRSGENIITNDVTDEIIAVVEDAPGGQTLAVGANRSLLSRAFIESLRGTHGFADSITGLAAHLSYTDRSGYGR